MPLPYLFIKDYSSGGIHFVPDTLLLVILSNRCHVEDLFIYEIKRQNNKI